MSVIVAKSPSGGGGSSSTNNSQIANIRAVIPEQENRAVDVIIDDQVIGAKWMVVLTTFDERMCAYEIYGYRKSATAANFTVYAVIGDVVMHEVEVTLENSHLCLKVTNNESGLITMAITRIGVLQ